MGSKKITSTPTPTTRKLRRNSSTNSSTRLSKLPDGRRSAAHIDCGASVTDKLEALKNLISSENKEIKPDQLFQETADYIVLLKTQVFVLQKLIDFYGSQQQQEQQPQENRNSV